MIATWIFVITVFLMGVWEMCSGRKLVAGCLFFACACTLSWQSWSAEEAHRGISAVMCDKQEEMQAAYDVHMEDEQRPFDVVMEMVKQRAGSNSCASVKADVVVEAEVAAIQNPEMGRLSLYRVRAYKTCGEGVCVYFPKGTVAYVILKAKGDPA